MILNIVKILATLALPSFVEVPSLPPTASVWQFRRAHLRGNHSAPPDGIHGFVELCEKGEWEMVNHSKGFPPPLPTQPSQLRIPGSGQ